jgi:lipopolysaccharide/colanic/teichoic acid biosynthesis glycosyltransferase
MPAIQARTESLYATTGKRVLDLCVVAFAAPFLVVPMLVLALAILLDSGPPILFRQRRVGRFGEPFEILKFRTMKPGAAAAGTITIAGDPRVTRAGRFLRRWKLDELPQVWNVIRGDMSLVGPRADVPGFADRLDGADRLILAVRPGITGPATLRYKDEEALLAAQDDPIRFNSEVVFPDKVRINKAYVEQLSFGSDLRCIAGTLMLLAGDGVFRTAALPQPPSGETGI